jgi:hypothetical protein
MRSKKNIHAGVGRRLNVKQEEYDEWRRRKLSVK